MTKTFIILLFTNLLSLLAFGQKPNENDVRQLFDKTLIYLRSSDTSSFIKQWMIDSEPTRTKSKVTVQELRQHFKEMQTFLDTVLTRNLKSDEIEIENMCDDAVSDKRSSEHCNYYFKIWFKYYEHYSKGMGFEIKFVKNKWYYLFAPDYSTSSSR